MSQVQSIEPAELQRRLAAGESVQLIDVREDPEWQHVRIEGAEHRPLSRFAEWRDQLDPEGGPYVLYCHHGIRSMQACSVLAGMGVAGLHNLTGGIDRWAKEVDPSLPTY